MGSTGVPAHKYTPDSAKKNLQTSTMLYVSKVSLCLINSRDSYKQWWQEMIFYVLMYS